MFESPREARADALLDSVRRAPGRCLKIFLGAAPGVGKTYAMLSAAQELKRQGVDVVVGLVETHQRPETQVLLEGLDVLPRRVADYRGRRFEVFDLDAALARRPAVLLVDELAHTNLPGGRHERRWQDVAELLDAGIEVYTALNVQHLESLNDQVRRITQVKVRETVPDAFLDRARDMVLIDLPPRELIERLRQGRIYRPDMAAAALEAFFSPTHLAALRELAVDTVAGHIDSDLRSHMLARGGAMPVRRRVLAAIDGYGQSDDLVRVARRVAERRGVPWSVAFVDTGASIEPVRRERLDAAMRLARRLGGEALILRGHAVVDELLAHADREGVGQILIGRTRSRPWAALIGRSLPQQLLRRAAHLELTIIATPVERLRARMRLRLPLPHRKCHAAEYRIAHGVMLVAVVLTWCADRFLSVANLSLILLTAVLVVAARTRMSVAFYTATMAFLGDNFLFTAPRYTLAISNADDAITVCLFFAAAIIGSRLATRLSSQVQALRTAHAHARVMLALGQRLAASTDAAGVRKAGAAALAQVLGCEVAVLGSEAGQPLYVMACSPNDVVLDTLEAGAAAWSQQHAEAAGRFTQTLSASACWMLPLGTVEQPTGVVALRFDPAREEPSPDERSTALAMVQDIGQALQRVRLADTLESVRVQGETERLRTALLSSVSHDLRSPLASMVGSAETLLHFGPQLATDERRDLLTAILGEGQRLDRYIQNLLDMTRLGHGVLQLQRDWTDLAEMIATVCRRLRKLYPQLPIVLEMPQDTLLLHVHAALIEQALFNILENAARFSPLEATVRIVVKQEEDGLHIDIHDQGPGIPEEERMQIFDMFYSVSRGDRGGSGTGLGLAICRGMIAAHGGHVEALPGEGGGTVIRVSLPWSAVPEEAA